MACTQCGAHVFASRGFRVAGQCSNCSSYDLVEIESSIPTDERVTVTDPSLPEAEPHPRPAARSSADATWAIDKVGKVLHWNEAAERLYGYTAQEILGSPIGLVIPAERKQEERELLRRVWVGEPLALAATEGSRKDGTRVQVSLGLSPLRDRTGAITGAIGTVEELDHLTSGTTNRGARI